MDGDSLEVLHFGDEMETIGPSGSGAYSDPVAALVRSEIQGGGCVESVVLKIHVGDISASSSFSAS